VGSDLNGGCCEVVALGKSWGVLMVADEGAGGDEKGGGKIIRFVRWGGSKDVGF
jgi:hypothetical protein